jgi:predicted DNA-binding transcriptional regulator AlpA
MKTTNEASRLKLVVRAAPENCMVVVSPEYAQYFKSVPKDGRTYVVADPLRKQLLHWTYPDGTYARVEKPKYPLSVPELLLTIREKRVKGQPRRKKKRSRVADEFGVDTTVQRQSDDPPSICLIDIKRVMRISGFKKSFIYEQPDFPAPVRLGTSQRSAVRWVESEVVLWANNKVEKRDQCDSSSTQK